MPKLKTGKSVKKRFKITRTGKILFRPPGQDHFRAKKSGPKKRQLKKWREIKSRKIKKYLKQKLPYG